MLVLDKKELFEEVKDLESATVSGGGDGGLNPGVIFVCNVGNGGNVPDITNFVPFSPIVCNTF
ncbi:MAG: hypothetical protein QNJ51_00455 [Calothrix sp. MO_167.B12]|nr:hypothetical protein [Calothrix sp. MO_167.B12]